jgi:apolipoprotein N-acyltransferase
VARLAGYPQHGPRKAALTVGPGRPSDEPVLTAWAISFVFGGSSALLLLVANLFPAYWYFSFFALTPFLYRIIKATPEESCRLGLLFGLSFFGASATGWPEIPPFLAAIRLLCGTALFAFFGWIIGWARQRWGFNPSLVAVAWAGLELGLGKLGFAGGVLGETTFSHPMLHGLAGLFGLVAGSAIIVLLNSLLALALTKVIKAAKTAVRTAIEDVRTWDLIFAVNFATEKTYLVPEGRAPPNPPDITSLIVWAQSASWCADDAVRLERARFPNLSEK